MGTAAIIIYGLLLTGFATWWWLHGAILRASLETEWIWLWDVPRHSDLLCKHSWADVGTSEHTSQCCADAHPVVDLPDNTSSQDEIT